MAVWTWKQWTPLVWCAAAYCPVAAEEPNVGIVRISSVKPLDVQPVGRGRKMSGYGSVADGSAMGNCPTDAGGCPHCQGHGCMHCTGHGCKGWLGGHFQEHWCNNSPDYGYSIPGKYPIERRGVQYVSYFPAAWYGSGGGAPLAAPVIYTPTDTAQLGFYYQHAPFWQPQPNPLPARPIPAQWHNYATPTPASAFHNAGAYMRGGAMTADSCPVDGSPTPINDTLQAVPHSDTPPAPKPPMDESAAKSPYQRANGGW